MPTNSNFNFTKNSVVTLELPFSEHVEELRQRLFLIIGIIILFTCFAFIEVKSLVKILELPISNVKFFQLSPGEYFISTIKISFYTGLLFSSPFVIGQLAGCGFAARCVDRNRLICTADDGGTAGKQKNSRCGSSQ